MTDQMETVGRLVDGWMDNIGLTMGMMIDLWWRWMDGDRESVCVCRLTPTWCCGVVTREKMLLVNRKEGKRAGSQ